MRTSLFGSVRPPVDMKGVEAALLYRLTSFSALVRIVENIPVSDHHVYGRIELLN